MEIIQKIRELHENSPLLQREIKDIKTSSNDPRVDFHGGSWIRVVAANDGARGARANLLIVDEYRLVPNDIVETVLRKFLISPRLPKFFNKPEYKDRDDLKERNKQIFLSSAWYKAHESWDRVVTYKDMMTEGKSYFVCSIPYQISIKEGLLLREDIEDEMAERTFSEIKFLMEMEALFFGSNMNSYFTFEEIHKNRTLTKAYYPREVYELVNDKTVAPPKKEPDEIRVVSADIATMSGSENDASAFTVARLIRTNSGYDRHIIYSEALEGAHTSIQANRIRQLYDDFNCDYIVLDTFNSGIGVYDRLTEHTTDPQRGTEYTPLSCMNDDRLAQRCVFPNAPKVVYSVRASGQLNSEIASNFKDSLRRGIIKLPVIEDEAKDILDGIKGYSSLPPELKVNFRLPYIQTTLMANEILNLEFEVSDAGNIKLKEVGGARKDRYSSVSYLNYFASELEVKNRKRNTDVDYTKLIRIHPPKRYR